MKNILVVEDDFFTLQVLEKVLSNMGFHVEKARNKREAFFQLEKTEFNLIITDIMLPYTGGFEIIDRAKTLPSQKDVPVIVVSGMDKTILEATKSDADAFIRKPFKSNDIVKAVEKFLSQKKVG